MHRQLSQIAKAVVILAVAVIANPATPARADYPYGFVQITCAPEVHYVAVKRFYVYNLPENGAYLSPDKKKQKAAVASVERKYHIFESAGLKDHPQTCEIPAFPNVDGWNEARPKIVVRVTGEVDEKRNSEVSSYAHMTDQVVVYAYGRKVAVMGLLPDSSGPDSVEISANGVGVNMTKCAVPGIDDVPPGSKLPWDSSMLRCDQTDLDTSATP